MNIYQNLLTALNAGKKVVMVTKMESCFSKTLYTEDNLNQSALHPLLQKALTIGELQRVEDPEQKLTIIEPFFPQPRLLVFGGGHIAKPVSEFGVKLGFSVISHTVLILVGFYIVSIAVLLPLIPTSSLSEKFSPMVAALDRWGIGWAGNVINFVLITAILSTMLAAMFGLGRMMRSLAEEGQAPSWLKDQGNVPYRGILISGLAMLAGLGIGLMLPSVYLFLISSGGFALLFTYAVIMATHLRFRKKYGCPPSGKCQMPLYPYSTWIVFLSLIMIILSMPFISGQGTGLIAGIIMIAVFYVLYMFLTRINKLQTNIANTANNKRLNHNTCKTKLSVEFSRDLIEKVDSQADKKPE